MAEGRGGPADTPTSERMKDLMMASADALRHEAAGRHETDAAAERRVSATDVERVVRDWPEAPKKAAQIALERYGPPNEATPTKLFWYGNGPWKRTVVTRDVYTHHFPMIHSDYVWSTVDYRVPVERFGEVAAFDGSCLPDRTAGEVTARCDSEWANILTLNLMHDIVTGRRSVEEARKAFGEIAPAYAMGRPAPEAERLNFPTRAEGTEDVDEAVATGPMVEQMMKKVKDMVTGGGR